MSEPPSPKLIDVEIHESWKNIQDELKSQVITNNTEEWQSNFSKLKFIAGLDISVPKDAHSKTPCNAVTAMVIIAYPSLKIVHQELLQTKLDQPYVPGFLAFREFPAVKEIFEKVLTENPLIKPDVLLIDGNGILHPQRCGLACHIGINFDIPTIGVAKNLFNIPGLNTISKTELQNIPSCGDFIYLKSDSGEILGMALKTSKDTINPVYVSIGHKISLETAKNVVMVVSKYRVPEPIRIADHISRELIRSIADGDF